MAARRLALSGSGASPCAAQRSRQPRTQPLSRALPLLRQAFQGERPFARLRPVDAARAASTGRRPTELRRLPHAIRLVVTACWSDEVRGRAVGLPLARPPLRARPRGACRAAPRLWPRRAEASGGRRCAHAPPPRRRAPLPLRSSRLHSCAAQPNRRPPFLDLVPLLEEFAANKGLSRDSHFASYGSLGARLGCAGRPSRACAVQ